MKANDPAFPIGFDDGITQYFGLTKREYFAAMALQGLLATTITEGKTYEHIANTSVWCADALLAELAKEKP
jgi:hypothetical protein